MLFRSTTPEEQRRIQKYYVQMNLLNVAMFSNNFKRMIRIAKIVTKLDKKNHKNINVSVNKFRRKFSVTIEQAQNFLRTGLLRWDLVELGLRYNRVEIEEALEDLIEVVMGFAVESVTQTSGSIDIRKQDEEGDII